MPKTSGSDFISQYFIYLCRVDAAVKNSVMSPPDYQ
jgi:hypothetical protein